MVCLVLLRNFAVIILAVTYIPIGIKGDDIMVKSTYLLVCWAFNNDCLGMSSMKSVKNTNRPSYLAVVPLLQFCYICNGLF